MRRLTRASILFEKRHAKNDRLSGSSPAMTTGEKPMQMGLAHVEVSATSSLNPRRRSSPSGVGNRPRKAV